MGEIGGRLRHFRERGVEGGRRFVGRQRVTAFEKVGEHLPVIGGRKLVMHPVGEDLPAERRREPPKSEPPPARRLLARKKRAGKDQRNGRNEVRRSVFAHRIPKPPADASHRQDTEHRQKQFPVRAGDHRAPGYTLVLDEIDLEPAENFVFFLQDEIGLDIDLHQLVHQQDHENQEVRVAQGHRSHLSSKNKDLKYHKTKARREVPGFFPFSDHSGPM